MRSPLPRLIGASALLLLVATGCTATVTTDPADPAATESAGAVQSGADPDALRDALAEIDPALDTEQSVADADEICAQIETTDEETELETSVRDRFSANTANELTDDQVAEVLDVIRSQYCG